MPQFIRCFVAVCLLAGGGVILAAQAPAPVPAIVATSLDTAAGRIRQFAFDGDLNTFFASARNATAADHFTLVFDKPVAVKSILVITGRPQGGDNLAAGTLEISTDGEKYSEFARFADGVARAAAKGQTIRAVRVRPSTDLGHPLAIREFVVESNPPVAVFKYPIEFTVDVTDAPELKEWAEKVARVCERQYPMINEELKSAGFKPRNVITMRMKSDYKGVAFASGGSITGSVKYFTKHLDDVGAMVHETVHCVQDYRTRGNPGWLVEGIADYIRFFKYEPGKLGKIKANAHYNGSYRTTAAFLAFVADKYDKEIVRKLNKTMREGEYKEDVWRALTKKSVQELDDEWRASRKD
jgi:hypothetical protein